MRRSIVVWVGLVLVYAGFRLWYDGGGAPLSPAEVDEAIAAFVERGLPADRVEPLRAFLAADAGGDFVMANLIHFRAEPRAVPGTPPAASAQAALDRYMAHIYPALFRRACHPVLAGPVVGPALDLWGVEDASRWSLVGLVRYRSRRDMLAIALDPAFRDAHLHKQAAMEQTIAVPVEPFLNLGSPRVLVAFALVAIGLVHETLRHARRTP
jgi:hypothetical protein